ncbi:hypothetical protein [Brotaphodocola sp.]|uniref:hypothetical protein n=1 Tax=Brotaphodocola sp. TaxID=3073577 RepID=UPI003D7E42E3
MKMGRRILTMTLVMSMTLLTACSPILKSFDPDNVQLSYRVPEKREQKTPDMEIETQMMKMIAQVNRDKYDAVDGTDAYYLLPTGTPLPEGLVDFQSLGFLDDKTTCYAYQALYALDDGSGLGGMPEQGTAGPMEDVKEAADHIHQMVTVLMKYNTETREYKVLYHKIEDVVVSYVVTEDDSDTTAKRLRVSKASELPEGKR